MKISEFIKKLQQFKKEHGDLEVWATEFDGGGYYSSDYQIEGTDNFLDLGNYRNDKGHYCRLNCLD